MPKVTFLHDVHCLLTLVKRLLTKNVATRPASLPLSMISELVSVNMRLNVESNCFEHTRDLSDPKVWMEPRIIRLLKDSRPGSFNADLCHSRHYYQVVGHLNEELSMNKS